MKQSAFDTIAFGMNGHYLHLHHSETWLLHVVIRCEVYQKEHAPTLGDRVWPSNNF